MYVTANTKARERIQITPILSESTTRLTFLRGEHRNSMQARQTRVRVSSALRSIEFEVDPRMEFKVTGAPVCSTDLAFVAAAMCAPHESVVYLGEVSLGGAVRSVRGTLRTIRHLAETTDAHTFVIASDGANESFAWYLRDLGVRILEADQISDLLHFEDLRVVNPRRPQSEHRPNHLPKVDVDMQALRDAVDEGRNILLVGHLGTGTQLARHIATRILPEMSETEERETVERSEAAGLYRGYSGSRPFRAPHHTISLAGAVGDQRTSGEVGLAHNGVICLDEINKFRLGTLEAISAVTENGKDRTGAPVKALIVGAVDPCMCGMQGSRSACTCSVEGHADYKKRLAKVSAPFNFVTLRVRTLEKQGS